MSRALRLALSVALPWVLGCAGSPPPPAPPEPARVSVEVLRGLAPEALEPPTAPVAVILDVTRSMTEPTAAGVSHHAAARRAARRFVRDVSSERPLWLYALGSGSGDTCQPVYRGSRASAAGDRGALLREVESLPARGEASLPSALDGVRAELARGEALRGSRVVVFSDLRPDCVDDRDLCSAASRLAAAGVRLDLVAIGAEPTPACLRQPDGLAEGRAPAPEAPEPVAFRVVAGAEDPAVVGCSESGGLSVAVPAGEASVVLALDPPLRVERELAAGGRYVLQVLDFPALDPPVRKWRWVDARGEAAAPEGSP